MRILFSLVSLMSTHRHSRCSPSLTSDCPGDSHSFIHSFIHSFVDCNDPVYLRKLLFGLFFREILFGLGGSSRSGLGCCLFLRFILVPTHLNTGEDASPLKGVRLSQSVRGEVDRGLDGSVNYHRGRCCVQGSDGCLGEERTGGRFRCKGDCGDVRTRSQKFRRLSE